MAIGKGASAYIMTSTTDSFTSYVGNINSVDFKINGKNVDVTALSTGTPEEYTSWQQAIKEVTLGLRGQYEYADAGQAFIQAEITTGAGLWVKFAYDGTHYIKFPAEVDSWGVTDAADNLQAVSFDLKKAKGGVVTLA